MDNFLPGSASLVDVVDKKVLLLLRDGRNMLGWLRSYDQFANLVLQDTLEIVTLPASALADGSTTAGASENNLKSYAFPKGVVLVRGENVVLLAEDQDQTPQNGLPQKPKQSDVVPPKTVHNGREIIIVPEIKIKQILAAKRKESAERERKEVATLHRLGFCVEVPEGDSY